MFLAPWRGFCLGPSWEDNLTSVTQGQIASAYGTACQADWGLHRDVVRVGWDWSRRERNQDCFLCVIRYRQWRSLGMPGLKLWFFKFLAEEQRVILFIVKILVWKTFREKNTYCLLGLFFLPKSTNVFPRKSSWSSVLFWIPPLQV